MPSKLKGTYVRCDDYEFDKLNQNAQKSGLSLSRFLIERGLVDDSPISPDLRNNIEQIKYELSLLEHHFSLLRKKAHFQQLAQSGELKLLTFYLTASAKYLHDVFFPNSSFDPNTFAVTDNQHSKSSLDDLNSDGNLHDANSDGNLHDANSDGNLHDANDEVHDDIVHEGLNDDLNKNNLPTNLLDLDSSILSPLPPLSILTQFPTNHFPFLVSYSCASSIVDVNDSGSGDNVNELNQVVELNQIVVEHNVVDVVKQSAIGQTEISLSLSEINQNQINQNLILDSGATAIVSTIDELNQIDVIDQNVVEHNNVAQQNTIEQNVVEHNLIENNTFQQNVVEQSVLPSANLENDDLQSTLLQAHLHSVDSQVDDLQYFDLQSKSLPLPLALSTHSLNELINDNSLINDATLVINDDNLHLDKTLLMNDTPINHSPLVDDLSDLPIDDHLIDDRLVEQKIIQMISHEFNMPISSVYSSIKEFTQSLADLKQDSASINSVDNSNHYNNIDDDPDEPYYDDPDIDRLEASINRFFDHVYSSIRSDIAKSKANEVDISNISTSKSSSNASLSNNSLPNNSLPNNSLPIASLATSSLLASKHSITQQQDILHLDNLPVDNFHLDNHRLDNQHLDISPGHVLSHSSNTTSQISTKSVSDHGSRDSSAFDETSQNCSLINKCNLPSIAPAVFFCDVNQISILDNGDILIPKELFDSFSHLSPSLLRQQLLSSASTIDRCIQTHSSSNNDSDIFSGDSDILSSDSDISSKEAP